MSENPREMAGRNYGRRTWSVADSRIEGNSNDTNIELRLWFGETLDML